MIVALALTQALPMILTGTVDRYHLAVAAPLVPFLAAAVSRTSPARPGPAHAWALAAIALGVAFYAVAEQDRQAWRAADHTAALSAYSSYDRADVYTGFDEEGDDWVVPELDRTGRPPSGIGGYALGLTRPRAALRFAGPDAAGGTPYSSLAPGRIVLDVLP